MTLFLVVEIAHIASLSIQRAKRVTEERIRHHHIVESLNLSSDIVIIDHRDGEGQVLSVITY